MVSDEQALLAAITVHPDDDTPRLVYADWLDEHGYPERAEQVRLEVEDRLLARVPPAVDGTVPHIDWLKVPLPSDSFILGECRRQRPEWFDSASAHDGEFLERFDDLLCKEKTFFACCILGAFGEETFTRRVGVVIPEIEIAWRDNLIDHDRSLRDFIVERRHELIESYVLSGFVGGRHQAAYFARSIQAGARDLADEQLGRSGHG